MEAHIKIRNLNVSYKKVSALKDVNLDIPRKQITAIIGPSGCGKSTLLKSLNRFHDLTDDAVVSGEVLLDDIDLYAPEVEVTEVRTKVGLIAQRPSPLPMSIYDNVAFGAARPLARRAVGSSGWRDSVRLRACSSRS